MTEAIRVLAIIGSIAVAMMLLSGCASYTPNLPTDAAFDAASSYLYGDLLIERRGGGFGFVITDAKGSEAYIFKFSDGEKLPVIKVVPGTYQLDHVIGTYGVNEIGCRIPVRKDPRWPLAYRQQFTVAPGLAYYVGACHAEFKSEGTVVRGQYMVNKIWSVLPPEATPTAEQFRQATERLKKEYVVFGDIVCKPLF